MSLRDELIAAIQGWGVDLGDVKDDTPLMRSGLFDSLALFNLVVWVEGQIGAPVDPTAFDLLKEWDTVAGIVNFVESHRRQNPIGKYRQVDGSGR
jgi:acyl carrier protein